MTDVAHIVALRRAILGNGYQPIAVKNGEKIPFGHAWQMKRGMPPLNESALNTGILCEGLCPADIDVDDPDAVDAIIRVFDEVAGHTLLVRSRPNSPRRTLLYRAPDGTKPRKRVINLGSVGKVEFLGLGQQFVAYGVHPSGVDFEWPESGPDIVNRNDTIILTPEGEAEIVARLRAAFDIKPEEPANSLLSDHETRVALPVGRDIGARERAAFEAALRDETSSVATAPEGTRNPTLNNAAFSLGQMVASGWGSAPEVETALTEAAFAAGLRQPEIRKTIASGLKGGAANPRSPVRSPAMLPL